MSGIAQRSGRPSRLLKVVLTTNDLVQVDTDFVSARQFMFYGVDRDTAQFLACVQFKDRRRGAGTGERSNGTGGGGRCCAAGAPQPAVGTGIEERIASLRGASVLFTLAMSDPQAVRVQELGVFPVKLAEPRSIYQVLDRLQEMLAGAPPLWLRRALRPSPTAEPA